MPSLHISQQYEARVKVLKALAHPTRLFLVEELAAGERCVCELTEAVGDDISTVSKHLSRMKEAGVVTSERRGQQIFYALRIPCVLEIFGCMEKVLETMDEASAAECCAVADGSGRRRGRTCRAPS